MTYLAHIAGDGRKQTAAEHLNGTAERCALFAAPFGAEELGRLAGLSHDLGKYSMEFQRRLAGGPKVDHATAGAFACWRMGQPLAAFAAAGHHGGLPDGGTQGDSPDAGTFWGRMKRAERGMLPDCSPWTEEIALPSPAPPPCGAEPLSLMFFTRMLFSCLTDADFLDTEAFMDGSPRPEHPAPLDDLWERLQRHISGWFPPQGELNSRRCAVLEQCIRMGKTQPPGLFTLTVPTGGGKTVASLAFALAQARARGLRRIIYVIPYTSIIEQTAQEFRTILGAENVLEHHSNAAYEIDAEATPKTVRLAQAAENWDMPVVVTTAVQFFESLYANRPSQCRKLHNLAGSVILFDEAQLLPLPCLRPCVHAIAQLVQHYGASAVLCTATQPALGPLFAEFLPGRPAVELCPPELCPPESFRRVCFRQAGRLDWDTLSGQLQQHEQVLCVVNSRKSAQEIFTRLSGEGNFHLSTLMYPAHRRAKLEEIRRRLREGLPCRVISTSLIEAGVDVDFPMVWRETAGLDSIAQAAGRCNREGKRDPEFSIVTYFQSEHAVPVLQGIPIQAAREALRKDGDPAKPETMQHYFTALRSLIGENMDKSAVIKTTTENILPMETVAKNFHLIDKETFTVYIPLGEGEAVCRPLLSGQPSREDYRRAGQYSVGIYDRDFQSLYSAGDIRLLSENSAVLVNLKLYDSEVGLSTKAEAGKAEFI